MEIWKDIKDCEGLYQVSDLGRVKSIRKNKILKPWLNHAGYKMVCLYIKTIKKHSLVHRLVAQTFILNPENKPTVNHKNGIRNDSRLKNLEWCTHSENARHSYRELNRRTNSDKMIGEKNPSSKLREYEVKQIKIMLSWGIYCKDIANLFNVSVDTIYRIKSKKNWSIKATRTVDDVLAGLSDEDKEIIKERLR
jgi:hypothetical protein